MRGQGTTNNPSYSVESSFRPSNNYTYKALTAEEAKTYCETYSGSQTSSSMYTYASQASTGYPSAGYVEAPASAMEPEVIEPLNGELITGLIVTDSTRKSWGLDTDIQPGDRIFGDREVVWETLPAQLIGGEMILTACDAKSSAGDSLASFTAGADMTVYIGLDSRVENVPSWMSGYTVSGMTARNNNGVEFILYQKTVRNGDTVTLGAQGQDYQCVNYAVFAVSGVHGITGDINGDGAFSIADVVMLQKWLLAFPGTQLADWQAGDLNADGRLDIFDLCLMRELLAAGSSSQQEPGTSGANTYEPDGFTFSGKIYLVGDSTVCDYDLSTQQTLDRYGWGMKLAEQYNGVTVSNLALSGRSSRSFLSEQNYQTLKNSLGEGDYLFIQFGHNDEKTDEATYPGLGTYPGLDWSTLDSNGMDSQGRYSYEYILAAYYINLARNKGAVPVLVTPITRRGSDGSPYYQAHTDYQNGMITLGNMYGIPVVDATTLTKELYEQVGKDNTAAFHCWTDAEHTTTDNTHLSSMGASEVAAIIAAQTKELGLSLGEKLK